MFDGSRKAWGVHVLAARICCAQQGSNTLDHGPADPESKGKKRGKRGQKAANLLARHGVGTASKQHEVIPVKDDEFQVQLGLTANKINKTAAQVTSSSGAMESQSLEEAEEENQEGDHWAVPASDMEEMPGHDADQKKEKAATAATKVCEGIEKAAKRMTNLQVKAGAKELDEKIRAQGKTADALATNGLKKLTGKLDAMEVAGSAPPVAEDGLLWQWVQAIFRAYFSCTSWWHGSFT